MTNEPQKIQPTERVKRLMAMIDAAEERAKAQSQGGGLPLQAWRFVTTYLPPPIVAVGVVLFAGFHVWSYYNTSQLDGYENRAANAKEAIAELQGDGVSLVVDGKPVGVKKFRAEVEKKQQEAARAKTEADALTAQAGAGEVRVGIVAAQVRQKQAEAEKATLGAQAATAKFGWKTLEDRAQLIKWQLAEARGRMSSAEGAQLSAGYDVITGVRKYIKVACEDNSLARDLGCPRKYWQTGVRR